MLIHWGQLLATVGTATGIAVAVAALWHPFGKRRDQRKLDALTAAATLAKVEMRETMTEIVTGAVDQVRADVKDVAQRVERQELAMATQFGGNGGGIRQAINEQGQHLAQLVGRFDQHIVETKNT